MSDLPFLTVPLGARVTPGDDLAKLLVDAIGAQKDALVDGDILIVCQKVVSKAEGRVARYTDIQPSALARTIAAQAGDKDPRIVEVVLQQTVRIIQMDRGA